MSVCISPYSEELISATCDRRYDNHTVLLEPLTQFQFRRFALARSLNRCENGRTVCRVINYNALSSVVSRTAALPSVVPEITAALPEDTSVSYLEVNKKSWVVSMSWNCKTYTVIWTIVTFALDRTLPEEVSAFAQCSTGEVFVACCFTRVLSLWTPWTLILIVTCSFMQSNSWIILLHLMIYWWGTMGAVDGLTLQKPNYC